MGEDAIGKCVVDVAVRLHRDLGRGLLETVYEVILLHALRHRGLQVERQIPVPIRYEEIRFDEGFRVDLMVEDKVIIELKCVERLNNAHKKQLLTYLRLADKRLGYLLNFGAPLMRDGIVRIANRLMRVEESEILSPRSPRTPRQDAKRYSHFPLALLALLARDYP